MDNLKKIIYFLHVLTMLSVCSAVAFDLDASVDDEIRKNYNDTKLIKDVGVDSIDTDEQLPELPKITKTKSAPKSADIKTSAPADIKTSTLPDITPPSINKPVISGNIKIRKGTSFEVVSSNAISDWQKKGTNVKFVLKKPVNTKKYTIPAWTTFNGEIVESHAPQITCNGGLVAIKVYSMNYKGSTIPINAYIIRANDKKIFFNDIKGKRTYLKTMWKKGNWGRSVFDKMLNLTIKLGSEGSTLILSPFPFAYGTICFGVNTLVSPITAFFSKGGHVSIPSGSKFKIKLTEDTYIN